MSTTLRRILVTVVAALVVLTPSPASAADDIGLSRDGVTFTEKLSAPLFDPEVRWVPGDTRIEQFFVRNDGPSDGVMMIAAVLGADDPLLADDQLAADDILIEARADGGEWVEVATGVTSSNLSDRRVERGVVAQVDVRATFDPASTNQSQAKVLELDFLVNLSDALDDEVRSEAVSDRGGALPGTGATWTWWHMALAAMAIGGGLGLIRRRAEEEVPHE